MPNITIKKIVVFFTQNMFGKHLNDDDDDFTFIISKLLSYILHIFYFFHVINKIYVK